MSIQPLPLLLVALLAVPAVAQTRSAPKKDPTFPEAVEQAKQAVADEKYGSAVSSLQAAIRAVQKAQRAAILAGLPKPEGFEIEDEEPSDSTDAWAGVAAFGMTVQRHYRADDKSIDVEVMANTPAVQMISMMFANPAIIESDGGEVVQYGQHKAVLKKTDEASYELQILMHDKHLVKVTSHGLTDEELLKTFDQAFVDRMEKPLGK